MVQFLTAFLSNYGRRMNDMALPKSIGVGNEACRHLCRVQGKAILEARLVKQKKRWLEQQHTCQTRAFPFLMLRTCTIEEPCKGRRVMNMLTSPLLEAAIRSGYY